LKLLRGKKSEDIIFSGSEAKTRLSMAEVSLYLNNEDKKVPIEYSEIAITRRLYRDGTSEYLINKNEVRLQDIVMLLAKAQFGQKSYSVIGQGMIDAILISGLSERKDFFYEATGVKQYQIKKEQSESKLERTAENIKQVELTLQELEPHLRSLERQVKRLEKREEVEKELHGLQLEYYARKWSDLEQKKIHFDGMYTEKDHEKNNREKELSVLLEELHTLEESESRSESFEILQAEYQKILNEKNDLSRRLANISGRLDLEFERAGKMNIVWMNKRVSEITQKISEIESQKSILQEKLFSQETLLNQKQPKRLELEDSLKDLQLILKDAQLKMKESSSMSDEDVVRELENIYASQKNLVYSLEQVRELSDLEHIRRSADEVAARLQSLSKRAKRSGTTDSSQEFINLQQEINGIAQEKNTVLTELSVLQSQSRIIEEKMTTLDDEVAKLFSEKKNLDLQIAAGSDDSASKDALLVELRREKQEIEHTLTALEKKFTETKASIQKYQIMTCEKESMKC
jgi:chromosome segregation protein